MANGRDKYQTDRKCKQKVKYVLIIGDGMADFPIESLNGKTPLEAANKPVMDALAMRGIVGKVRTVPIGVPAGSDTAILSIFGFDPRKVYTGRSPLEAAGSGVKMEKGNVSFRCNLAAVSVDGGPYEQQTMISHSGGNIDGKDAQTLMYDLLADPDFSALLEKAGMRFTVNPSYRHIAILKEGSADVTLTPPHDILTRCVKDYLPRGAGDEMLLCLMKASYEYLNRHPLNVQRVKDGLPAANSLWFWGEGSAVVLDSFQKLFGHTGDVITAVPLVKGIAELAGLRHTDVPGANGDLDTNYAGKVEAALKALQTDDFAAIHIEAPDEMGHAGDLEKKLKAISLIDSEVLAPLLVGLDKLKERYRILILSDHYTPLSTRTHDGTPVPFLLYDSKVNTARNLPYGEKNAEFGGLMEEGTDLMPLLFGLEKK